MFALVFGNGSSTSGYVGEPYWAEMDDYVEIVKKSGFSRARGEAKRVQALEAYLSKIHMTKEAFQKVEEMSKRPFHTSEDGHVVIPSLRIMACLANASMVAPSAMRIPNLRACVTATDFVFDKTVDKAKVFDRFVRSDKTNQRRRQRSPYINDCRATGKIGMTASTDASIDQLLTLLQFAGQNVGIGAARKMGFGRFTVEAA